MSFKDSMLLAHQQEVSELNINEFTDLINGLADKAADFADNKHDKSCVYFLDKMEEKVNEMLAYTNTTGDIEKLFKYLYNSPVIDNPKYRQSIKNVNYKSVEAIRPDYLATVGDDVSKKLKKILAGLKSEMDIRQDIRERKYEKKLRKQLVKSSISVTDVKELFSYHNAELEDYITIDRISIETIIYPFLTSFKKDIEALAVIITKTKANIRNLDIVYDNINKAFKKTLADNKNIPDSTIKLAQYYWFNMRLTKANLFSYITTMIIEKVEAYSYLMNILIKYYEYMSNVLGQQGIVFTESLHEDWESDIDRDTILDCVYNGNLNIIHRYIENTIHYIQSESGIQDRSAYSSDNVLYDGVAASFATIIGNLHKFEVGTTQPDFVLDEIIDECDMNTGYVTQFSKLIKSVGEIIPSTFTVENGIAEIFNFEDNADRIMNLAHKAYTYVDNMCTDYNTNSYQMSEPDYKLVVSHLTKVKESIVEYSYEIVCALINRFHQLRSKTCNTRHICKDRAQYTRDQYFAKNVFSFEATDYTLEAAYEEYTDNEIINNAVLNNLMKEYKTLECAKKRGTIATFEAEQPVTAAKDNNGNDKATSTTPKVTVNQEAQPNANKDNDPNATNNGQNTNNKPSETAQTLQEKFKNFIKRILEAFSGKAQYLTNANSDTLENIKTAIANMNTEESIITMAPYNTLKTDAVISSINTAITNIRNVDPENIPTALRQGGVEAEKYLFPAIPSKQGNNDKLGMRVKTFYTYGSIDKKELVKYTGTDAKDKIQEIMNYCLEFSNTYKSISDACGKLRDEALSKQSDCAMHDTHNDEKADTKLTISGNVIINACRDYIAAILTVFEKRYIESILALKQLVPDVASSLKTNTNKKQYTAVNSQNGVENTAKTAENNDNTQTINNNG